MMSLEQRDLLKADDYARAWKDDYLSVEHVLLAKK